MNITNAQYQNDIEGQQDNIIATIDGKTFYIPINPSNRHYQAIQEWVAKGNTIQPAE